MYLCVEIVYARARTCACVCVWVWVCVSVRARARVCVRVCMCVCAYVCMRRGVVRLVGSFLKNIARFTWRLNYRCKAALARGIILYGGRGGSLILLTWEKICFVVCEIKF